MVNARDQQQRSALHWAAVAGRAQVVAILLARGARADMVDEAGATPVHLAVTSGSAATLKVFVEGGFGDTVDQEGRTPTMWAGGPPTPHPQPSWARRTCWPCSRGSMWTMWTSRWAERQESMSGVSRGRRPSTWPCRPPSPPAWTRSSTWAQTSVCRQGGRIVELDLCREGQTPLLLAASLGLEQVTSSLLRWIKAQLDILP